MAIIPEASGPTLVTRIANVDARLSAQETHASGWINVKSYGAKGDGVTDDTSAVGACYNALGSSGGELYFPPGTYRMNLAIAKPNVAIRGAGRSATASQGGNGATVFKPAVTTSPVLQIGDGASDVNHVSFSGFTAVGTAPDAGDDATSDGIVIVGAYFVNGTDFTVEGFGRDNIRIESSATRPSFYIDLVQCASRWARGASFKAVYGSTYVTALSITDFAIQGYSTSGALAVSLDGVTLNTAQGCIQCGGDRVGHVYVSGSNAKIRLTNVEIDSDTSTDQLVELNYARVYVSNYLTGFGSVDGLARWSDGTTTDLRGATQLTYNNARHNNPYVLGAVYFNQANAAATDEAIPASGSTPKISRSGASPSEYLAVENARLYSAKAFWSTRVTPTYGSTTAINASLGNSFTITPTNGTAFTVGNPTSGALGQRITITIVNSTGGALGTVTWSSSYKLASWTNPATGFSRSIDFVSNGTNWIEVSRTPADVPN